jgi:catechol 2,3-dioxygenase
MKIGSLGHIVLKVKDLARSEAFYCDVLGIDVSARADEYKMLFLTLGKHHDFALIESDAESIAESALGVDHFAFALDGGLPALAAARDELEAAGHPVKAMDHNVSKSLYLLDPDGNRLEIYVDDPDVDWRSDPRAIYADVKALDL